jgi:hypothetical protein
VVLVVKPRFTCKGVLTGDWVAEVRASTTSCVGSLTFLVITLDQDKSAIELLLPLKEYNAPAVGQTDTLVPVPLAEVVNV